ncbi:MAG: glycosyltransferase family 4 protein [Candidatus Omnitrophota bacterium]
MNILLVTTHLRMGGVSIYVVTLAQALKRRGHAVTVVSAGGELVKRLEREGVTHCYADIDTKSELDPRIFAAAYRLFWLIREKNVDIVHTNTRVTQVMGELLARATGATHLSTCHGFFKPRFGRRLFGCWGTKVIAISDAVREHLVNDFRIRKSRIEMINNGIDLANSRRVYLPHEKKVIRKEMELADGPVVGIIARLSSVKGHRYLVMAMRKVIDQIPAAQLLIIGEGPEGEELKGMVKDLKLEKSVIFAKTVLDTRGALAVMDVFVLPSIHEGLGLALLEALSCAVPVVASDTGGIYSIVKDNSTGLLAPPRDSAALAAAILRLLNDRVLAGRLAAAGKDLVYERFSIDDMTTKVEAVYREVRA